MNEILDAFRFECPQRGHEQVRTLKTQAFTCTHCQERLAKEYERRKQPKVKQPKLIPRLVCKATISSRIHDPAYMLSWGTTQNMDQLYHLFSSEHDPLEALIMKEERELERKYELWRNNRHKSLQIMRPITHMIRTLLVAKKRAEAA